MAVLVVGLLLATPLIINYAYMLGTPDGKPNTAFSATDALTLYCSVLTFLGTVLLGVAALYLNHKSNLTNKRLLNLESVRESKIVFEMYFSYVEEFSNIFDPVYVLGIPNDVRNDLDVFNVIKSSQLKALSIKRRLLFIDKDNSSHTYIQYVMDKYREILDIVIKPDSRSSKDTFKEIMSFIKSNADDNNKKSLEFMYYISKKLFKESI